MARQKALVAESRNYLVTTVAQAKEITIAWLADLDLQNAIGLGRLKSTTDTTFGACHSATPTHKRVSAKL